MDIKDLIKKQLENDETAGFPVSFNSVAEKYNQLTKDLVGLFGEVGEFANIVKKINIKIEKQEKYNLDIAKSEDLLKEELADAIIYILRISAILNMNIEEEVLNKIHINKNRFQ